MTEVTMANRALSLAKLNTIDSLDDNNEIAAYCRETLPLLIREGLSEHEWGFAKKRTALARLTITYSDWLYVFDLPDDMVQPRYYTPEGGTEYNILSEQEYEIFENSDSADRASGRMACNEPAVDLVYTKMMSQIIAFPQYFADALGYLFGYYLSMTFGGLDRANAIYGMWMERMLPRAIEKDHDRKRRNVRGEKTLTSDAGDIYDPFGYSK